MGAAVGHRRHVDHAQPLHALGVPQSQDHRDLAAHRVADDRGLLVAGVLGQRLGDLVGRVEIVEVGRPRRSAVLGHVEQQHPVPIGNPLATWVQFLPWPNSPWQKSTQDRSPRRWSRAAPREAIPTALIAPAAPPSARRSPF